MIRRDRGRDRSRKTSDRPSLIACRTTIGFGAPTKAGSERATLAARAPTNQGRAREARLERARVRDPRRHPRVLARRRTTLGVAASRWKNGSRRCRRAARRVRAAHRPQDRGRQARRRGARRKGEARGGAEGDRDPHRLRAGARSPGAALPELIGARRPDRLQQYQAQGHDGALGRRLCGPLHPLRRARARHGAAMNAWPARRRHTVLRHVPRLRRYCRPAIRLAPDGPARHPRDDARLDRARRGRPTHQPSRSGRLAAIRTCSCSGLRRGRGPAGTAAGLAVSASTLERCGFRWRDASIPGLDRVAGPEHEQLDRPQGGQMLDRLMGRPVLAEPDRVVRHHVDDALAHQGGQADRRPAIVGEDENVPENGMTPRAAPCRSWPPAMPCVAHAVMDEAARIVGGREHRHALGPGIVGAVRSAEPPISSGAPAPGFERLLGGDAGRISSPRRELPPLRAHRAGELVGLDLAVDAPLERARCAAAAPRAVLSGAMQRHRALSGGAPGRGCRRDSNAARSSELLARALDLVGAERRAGLFSLPALVGAPKADRGATGDQRGRSGSLRLRSRPRSRRIMAVDAPRRPARRLESLHLVDRIASESGRRWKCRCRRTARPAC